MVIILLAGALLLSAFIAFSVTRLILRVLLNAVSTTVLRG